MGSESIGAAMAANASQGKKSKESKIPAYFRHIFNEAYQHEFEIIEDLDHSENASESAETDENRLSEQAKKHAKRQF
jgi:hypothetical protein